MLRTQYRKHKIIPCLACTSVLALFVFSTEKSRRNAQKQNKPIFAFTAQNLVNSRSDLGKQVSFSTSLFLSMSLAQTLSE